MIFVALHMRPWIVKMNLLNKDDPENQTLAKILADDVILVTSGSKMLERFATALDDTHEFLNDTGAIVAPSNSFSFTNSKRGKKWLEETTWVHIKENINVVEGLRCLGGHISTKGNLRNPTQGDRLDKALGQLQRLRYLPASREDKAKLILVEVFPGCFYGI